MKYNQEITKRLKTFNINKEDIDFFLNSGKIPCININNEKKDLPSIILIATKILAKENNLTPYLIIVSETSVGTTYTILSISPNDNIIKYNISSLIENNTIVLNSNAIRLK